jgi:hypothetical protein
MAKINDGTLKDWKDGDKVTSDLYEADREILRVANNDNHDRIVTLEVDKPIQDKRLDDLEYNVTGTVVPMTFKELGMQNLTFDDIKLGYVDQAIAKAWKPSLDTLTRGIVEETTATDGQTVVNLTNSYTVGGNQITVEIDGVPQDDTSYTETSTTSITLSEALVAGQRVVVTIGKVDPNADARFSSLTTQLAERAKNFKDFYVSSDGTNYSPTLQRALDYCKSQYALGTIITLFVPKGEYQLLTGVSIDGYISSTITTTIFHLKMDGYFTANNGIRKMLSIKNCTGCELDIKIKGLNHSTTNLVYSTDISANVAGIDVALYLEACTYTKLDFYGKRWFGRGIESSNCGTNSWGVVRGDMVGQMMYIKGTSGFGNIGSVWVTEYMGSYFNITDLTIPYYENMILNTPVKKGIVFDSCVSTWIDVMNVGNNSDAYEVNLLSCSNMNISSLYIAGNNVSPTDTCAGLYIFQSYNLNITMNTGRIKGNALYIEGIKASSIKMIDNFSDNIGIITTNANYGVANTEINVFSRYRNGLGLIVQKGSSGQIIDSLAIGINAKDRAGANADSVDLKIVDSDSRVTILPSTNATTIDVPLTNLVKDIYSTTGTFTNKPNYQVGNTTDTKVSATTSLSGYAISSGLDNNIEKIGKMVGGTISLSNGTQTGNIAQNDILAQFDVSFAPILPVFTQLVVLLSTGAYQNAYASIEYDSSGNRTILKSQSVINTGNVKWVIANFSYYCNR